ncbi:MAG: hypothetical protein NUK62_07730, partial [Tenericutes bacterium]|nr:hypothetical protein [Mycoplasmatota bacterium]
MKVFSILKAIASGLVWGLGQVLNKQYLKAIFFFFFFVLFISIELFTSKYFEETDAMDKIVGKDFSDQYVQLGFLADYNYNKFLSGSGYESFELFLTEIGGEENLTEDLLIQFIAQDLKDNNPIVYKNSLTNVIIPIEEFDAEGREHLFRRETLYLDDEGKYYVERDVKLATGANQKQYIETTLLT